MGNVLSNFYEQIRSLFGNTKVRIIMIGLDNAGKTTILYQLKFCKNTPTIPTMGFNVETVSYKNFSLVVWDVGGQDKIRHLWSVYSATSNGIIFVVDSSDPRRITEAKTELFNILREKSLENVPLLVFCNKQDMVDSISVAEMKERLGLNEVVDRNWFLQPAVATEGSGLREGLDWFVNQLRSNSIFFK